VKALARTESAGSWLARKRRKYFSRKVGSSVLPSDEKDDHPDDPGSLSRLGLKKEGGARKRGSRRESSRGGWIERFREVGGRRAKEAKRRVAEWEGGEKEGSETG
jgi:hypothetical protein